LREAEVKGYGRGRWKRGGGCGEMYCGRVGVRIWEIQHKQEERLIDNG